MQTFFGTISYWNYNEALCSTCDWKREKFLKMYKDSNDGSRYSVDWLLHLYIKVILTTSNQKKRLISSTLHYIKMLSWRLESAKRIGMNKFTKVLVTIGVVFLFVIIFGAIAGAMSDAGRTPGILGLIALGALIGALRAIWKKPNDDNNEDDNNTSVLQK